MYTRTTPVAEPPARYIETAACVTLVGTAIAFGVCRFWDVQIPAAPMLTPALAALSALLATTAVRLEEAARKKAWLTLGLGVVLALVCLMFEAAMTHMGLVWLDARENIAPDWALWPASIGLSLFNVAAGFVFLRPIPEPAPAVAVSRPLTLPRPEPIRDPEIAATVARIEEAVARRRKAVG